GDTATQPSGPNDAHAARVPRAPTGVAEPVVARKERLLNATRALLQELSGSDFAAVDVSASFLELGLDSLLLTQAAQLFQRKFGVRITFRQLMEDLCSLDALATHLDVTLPPEAFAPAQPAAMAPQEAPAVMSPGAAGLEQLLQQQLQLTNQLLQVMGRQPVA